MVLGRFVASATSSSSSVRDRFAETRELPGTGRSGLDLAVSRSRRSAWRSLRASAIVKFQMLCG